MKVRYTQRAASDLADISEYHAARDPALAKTIGQALRAAMRNVGRHPLSGRAQQGEGVRKIVVRRFGYVIYYRTNEVDDTIDVITIRHGARDRLYDDK